MHSNHARKKDVRARAQQTGQSYAAALAAQHSVRASYTGEHLDAAAQGAAGRPGLGLDECTAEQRRLRVLLALAMFNAGTLQHPVPGSWAVRGLTSYSPALSAQPAHLAVVVGAAFNAVRYLVPRSREGESAMCRVPGLRVEAQVGDTFLLHHLPTGAQMSVTEEATTRLPLGEDAHRARRLQGTDVPLSESEGASLAEIPPLAKAAEVLLAGLLVRLNLRDPQGGWALRAWDTHPLDRPMPQRSSPDRRLWGYGPRWELEWVSDFPREQDVVAALTDPQAGIPGAEAVRVHRGWDIHLNDASLALRSQPW
ncbi:hypothetical protein ACWGII_18885 [Streptomyces sp. NPDC054855]